MADRTETLLFLIDVQVNNARALRALDAELDAVAASRERRLFALQDAVGGGAVGGGSLPGTPTAGREGGVVGVRGPVAPGGRTNPVVTVAESGQAAGLGALAAASAAASADQANRPAAAAAPLTPPPEPPVDKQWLESAAQEVASKVLAPEQQRIVTSIETVARTNGATNGGGLAAALAAARAAQGNGAPPSLAALTAAQAASRLNMPISRVYQMASSGNLAGAQKQGGQWVIPEQAIIDALAAGGAGAGGGGGGGPHVAVAPGGGGGGGPGLLRRLGWGTGFAGAAGFGTALSFAGLDFGHLLTTGLGVAGSAAGAGIGGGLLGLGSLGKLLVGGGADALAFKTTLTNVHALSTALDNLQQAQAVYGKNSRQAATAQAQLNFQMAQAGPAAASALQVAQNASALSDFWRKASAGAQTQAASIMDQVLRLGTSFVPLVAAAAQRNLSIINQGIKPLFAWLQGPQGIQIFNDLENAFAKQLPTAIHAGSQAFELLLRVMDIASSFTGGFVSHLDHLFTRLNSMDNAQLAAVIHRYVNDFRLWDHFIKLLVTDIYLLFHQDVGTGNSIIQTLTTMLEKLHAYETSARGSAQIQNIFMIHKTEVQQLLHILGGLISTFSSVYMVLAPALVQAMNNVVLPVIKTVADILASIARTSPFAATLIGLGLIAAKAGGVAATATAVKSLVGWLTGLKAASAGLGAVGVGGAAAAGGAAAGAGGAAAGAGFTTAEGLGAMGLGGTSAAFMGAGGLGAGIAAAAATALPLLLAGGGLAIVLHSILNPSVPTFTAGPHGTGAEPVGGVAPTRAALSRSGRAGQGQFGSAGGGSGFQPGDTLEIKKIGDYSNYSATQLAQLIKEMKEAGAVKVNGISQPRDQVLKLAEAALKVKDDWNKAFNSAWSDVNLFFRNTSKTLPALRDDFESNMRLIASTMGVNSNEGRRLVAENVQKMVTAVTHGMLDGKIKVAAGMTAINAALKTGMDDNATSWGTEWRDMFNTVALLYKHHKLSTAQYLSDLRSIQKTGLAHIKGDAETSYQHTFANLKKQYDDGLITKQQFDTKVHAAQLAANKQQATDLTKWSGNVIAAMVKAGTASVGGVNAILTPLNHALKALGAKPLSLVGISIANVQSTVTAGVNAATSGALAGIGVPGGATGMKVSAPTYITGEEAPAHPEYVLATNPAYRQRNLGLWAAAGRDLGVRGFAQGGRLGYGQLEGLWDQAGGPPGMAGLMAAIALAESGGDPSIVNSIGASGLWQIHPPEPGDLNPLTNARDAVAKWRSQGLSAWVTYVTGAYKQFLQGGVPPAGAFAQLHAPKVTGNGALADMLRAGLGLTTKDANAYLSHAAAALASTGGGGGRGGSVFQHGKFVFPLPAGSWHAGQVDQGWDLSAAAHTPEFAVAAGTITGHGIPGFGPWAPILTLDGGGGVYYGHAGPGGELPIGTHVSAGQVLGEVGAGIVGKSTGPHLEIGFYPPGSAGAGSAMKAALGYAAGGIPGFPGYATGGTPKSSQQDPKVMALLSHGRRAAPKPGKAKGLHKGIGVLGSVPGTAGYGMIGTDGPLPFNVSDYQALNDPSGLLAQILALDGTSAGGGGTGGDAQKLSNLIQFYTGMWGSSLYPTPNFNSWNSPADFVLTTDARGNTVPAFISPNINTVAGELGQMVGWQSGIVGDLSQAYGLTGQLEPEVQHAIARRVTEVAKIKKRIKDNIKKVKDLQAKIKAEQGKKVPYPKPKNKAQSAANKAFDLARKKKIAGWNDQISKLESENQKLAGNKESVGSGGELATITGQLGSPAGGGAIDTAIGSGTGASGLYELLSTVQGWQSGLGGATGDIASQSVTLSEYQQGLGNLLPGASVALQAALANAAAGTVAANTTANPLTGTVGFTYQGQNFLAGLARGGVMGWPWGGSFAAGGVVPGPLGRPTLIEAHGGETITPPAKGGGGAGLAAVQTDLRDLCAALREHKQAVEQNTHATSQNTNATSAAAVRYRSGGGWSDPLDSLSSDQTMSLGVGN